MSERIGIFGASGSGKTSALRQTMNESKITRVIFIDPTGEARRKKWRGFKNAMSPKEVGQIVSKSPEKYKISFEPRPGFECEDVHKVCEFIVRSQKSYDDHGKKLLLAADEMNLYFTHHMVTKCLGMAEICSRGRHYGIELIGVSQGVSEVSTRFRRNLSAAFVLRQSGKADVSAAADLVNMSLDEIKSLKNFDLLISRNGEVKKMRTKKFS